MSSPTPVVSYHRALEAVTAWREHSERLQAERDAARRELAALRAELRRLRDE
jgi:heme-degrading monooxygenase HmoA